MNANLLTLNGALQIAAFFAVILLLVKPLGLYMARLYNGERVFLSAVLGPIERGIYRCLRIRPEQEMGWKAYALAVVFFGAVNIVFLYGLLRLQHLLPLNPEGLPGLSADLAFNTAVSFVTNTDWQSYTGENTLSYFSQMVGLTVQNFLSAATGMAVLAALTRGLARKKSSMLGNFWQDLSRGVLYILLPLSLIFSVALVSQGVVQNLSAYGKATLTEAVTGSKAEPKEAQITEQAIPMGPAASQVAIKQLGTNGGGFFGANSAHPLENPTPLSNFMELVAILLIPAALCYSFGYLVGDRRQGWALLLAMNIIFIPLLISCVMNEQWGNPRLAKLGVDMQASSMQPGGNMEGKELRFGIAGSALWASATTAASNGSMNSSHDSMTPLGGLSPFLLMQFGEVVYGGAGTGLYGMAVFVIIAVFIAGLMVGRTPEYLGKKIGTFEIKMASIAMLVPCATALIGTAIAVTVASGKAGILNPGAQGFSEILYAFTSAANNNGSAFAGLSANTPFYNIALGIAMLLGRYWIIIPVLALAGSFAAKNTVPVTAGTLPTHSLLFIGILVGVIVMVGVLTFVPALALGPIVQHLHLIH